MRPPLNWSHVAYYIQKVIYKYWNIKKKREGNRSTIFHWLKQPSTYMSYLLLTIISVLFFSHRKFKGVKKRKKERKNNLIDPVDKNKKKWLSYGVNSLSERQDISSQTEYKPIKDAYKFAALYG